MRGSVSCDGRAKARLVGFGEIAAALGTRPLCCSDLRTCVGFLPGRGIVLVAIIIENWGAGDGG